MLKKKCFTIQVCKSEDKIPDVLCVFLCVMSLKNKSASEYKSCVVLSLYWPFRTYSEYTFFPLHNIALFMQLQWQPITSGGWDMGLWKSVLRNSTAFRKGWTMVNSSVWKALGLRGEAGQKSMANLMLEKFKTWQETQIKQMIPSLTQRKTHPDGWLILAPCGFSKVFIWSLCNHCHLETRTHTGQDRNTEWKYKQPLTEQRESLCKHCAISTELCPLLWSLREAKWPVWAVMTKNC